jgi:hypothetical protein
MKKETRSPTNDELDLSLETLDQWEDELDQFAAGIRQRLAKLTGNKIDTSGLMPYKQPDHTDDSDENAVYDNSEALQLLQSIRELTQ